MERLSFTSAETLDAYCEQIRADLSSRSDEQRRLVERALERLDQLEAQAAAMRSDDLAAEIATRRDEGRKLLAKLSTLNSEGEFPSPTVPVLQAAPPAELNGAFEVAPIGGAPFHEPEALSAIPIDTPSDPAAVPTTAFAAPFESGAPQMEALWQQPVDLKPFAQDVAPETPEAAPTTTAVAEAEGHEAEPAAVLSFGEPVAQPIEPSPEELESEPRAGATTEAQLPSFGSATVPVEVEPTFGASAETATPPSTKAEPSAFGVPVAADQQKPEDSILSAPSKSKTEASPAGLNWSWGSETESPAWAALLVEDTPVPVEPLTDSHFGQLLSPSEIANATPTAENPPAVEKTNGAHPLILNVKVGEWASEHPLSKPELLVGRRDLASRCMPDVEVMYDQAVSRRHLRISKDNGHYLVEDLESTNGTTLNGRSLRPGHPEILQAGDEMEIGEFTLLKIASV